MFCNVEYISEYLFILLLITLYSNDKEIGLHQSVAKVITWAPTFADSALLGLCIDFVLFLLEAEKSPLMTANKVGHSPFSYQIFAMQVWVAIRVCYAHVHRRFAKKEQKHASQSTFFYLCD
jgi:hypothetical protein